MVEYEEERPLLSGAQINILKRLGLGETYDDITENEKISSNVVGEIIREVKDVLGAKTSLSAVIFAIQQGLVSADEISEVDMVKKMEKLSETEMEMMDYIVTEPNMSKDEEIGDHFSWTLSTVKTFHRRIARKLGSKNRIQSVVVYMRSEEIANEKEAKFNEKRNWEMPSQDVLKNLSHVERANLMVEFIRNNPNATDTVLAQEFDLPPDILDVYVAKLIQADLIVERINFGESRYNSR